MQREVPSENSETKPDLHTWKELQTHLPATEKICLW